MVGRYRIRHVGIRQLLISYPERRQPELITRRWTTFPGTWPATSGRGSRNLPPARRICVSTADSTGGGVSRQRSGPTAGDAVSSSRSCAIRAFYADLQAWPAAEPEQWAIWVAPCPGSDAEVRGFGIRKRRVKERMDDRTRQRQPLLSALMEHMETRYEHLRALLEHAAADGGETVTIDGPPTSGCGAGSTNGR
jgi:hypothetical protein